MSTYNLNSRVFDPSVFLGKAPVANFAFHSDAVAFAQERANKSGLEIKIVSLDSKRKFNLFLVKPLTPVA